MSIYRDTGSHRHRPGAADRIGWTIKELLEYGATQNKPLVQVDRRAFAHKGSNLNPERTKHVSQLVKSISTPEADNDGWFANFNRESPGGPKMVEDEDGFLVTDSKLTILADRASENVPSPFERDDYTDLKSFYDAHHQSPDQEDRDLILKIHDWRARSWKFIAQRLAYRTYKDPDTKKTRIGQPRFHPLPDLDNVYGNTFELADYEFEVADPAMAGRVHTLTMKIFGGSAALERGKASTRLPGSDVDATLVFGPDVSELCILQVRDVFLRAVKDCKVSLGVSCDYNTYFQFQVRHPITQSVDEMDVICAEALTRWESIPNRVHEAKKFVLKTCVQIGGLSDQLFKTSPSPTVLAAARFVEQWYDSQKLFSQEMDEEGKYYDATMPDFAFVDARASLELEIAKRQIDTGIKTRRLAEKVISDTGTEEDAKQLFDSYSVHSFYRLEAYTSAYSTVQVVLNVPTTRTFSASGLLTASLEQIGDSAAKAASREHLLSPSGIKPKTISRLSSILLQSRNPLIDPALFKSIPGLVDRARERLSLATKLDPAMDKNRADKILKEEKFLELVVQVVLEGIKADLQDVEDYCDADSCFKLREAASDPTQLVKEAELRNARLTNAQVTRLLLDSMRAIINALEIEDQLSGSILILREHLASLEDETKRAIDMRKESDLIQESIEMRRRGGKSVPTDPDVTLTLRNYLMWLTDQDLRRASVNATPRVM